jgi:two-component system phosphate regulon sensor histidine kinase PhoR
MKQRRRLFWRVYPSFLLITLLSLLALGVHAQLSMRRFFREHTIENLQSRAILLEGRIRPLLRPPDPERVDAVCKAAGSASGTRITVILPGGRVIGDSHADPAVMNNHNRRPEIRDAFQDGVGTISRRSATMGERLMYVAVRLDGDGGSLGVLRTARSMERLEAELRDLQRGKILFGLLVALLAAAASLWLSRRIARPIEAMRRGAETFAGGNLALRLPAPDTEELARLSAALNQMAQELSDRIRVVEDQRNELGAILSSMREGVLGVNGEERIININAAAARMFLRAPREMVGRTVQEVIRSPDLHRFIRASLAGETPSDADITFYHEGECVLNTHGTALKNAAGRRIGTLVVFHDVTRLRRLEIMRREFAANVSHEIKTPLTAIKGFVETLQSGALEKPEEARRFLEIIGRHTERLSAIIGDLMKLSEIEQRGQLPIRRAPLRPVLVNAVEVCRPVAESRDIAVELDCDPGLEGEINSTFLEQALVNLVDNAIKYGPDGGRVWVAADRESGEIRIRVRDQGVGIPAAHLPRIFERFYRVDKSRSRKEGGTGLGLAIVKHIAQAHGGRVIAESETGEGSTFTVCLPGAPVTEETPNETESLS